MEAATQAIEAAFGVKPALVREGGSVGAILKITKYVDTPIIMLPLSLPEQGWHAPGEFFDWGQASGGIKMYAYYFDAVAGQ
jgi:acetylornithine deacetylase/succinyl-diaminopimelate desuccinylase-like protein